MIGNFPAVLNELQPVVRYFSKSTGSFVMNCRFSPIIAPNYTHHTPSFLPSLYLLSCMVWEAQEVKVPRSRFFWQLSTRSLEVLCLLSEYRSLWSGPPLGGGRVGSRNVKESSHLSYTVLATYDWGTGGWLQMNWSTLKINRLKLLQDCRKITNRLGGIYKVYRNLMKENRRCEHATGWTCKH